jgi:hypothetical protein
MATETLSNAAHLADELMVLAGTVAAATSDDAAAVIREAAAQLRLRSLAPELQSELTKLVSLFEAIRDDTVSARMGFGATQEERRYRTSVLMSFVEANAGRIDERLDAASEVLKRAEKSA